MSMAEKVATIPRLKDRWKMSDVWGQGRISSIPMEIEYGEM